MFELYLNFSLCRSNLIRNLHEQYERTGYIWEQYDDDIETGKVCNLKSTRKLHTFSQDPLNLHCHSSPAIFISSVSALSGYTSIHWVVFTGSAHHGREVLNFSAGSVHMCFFLWSPHGHGVHLYVHYIVCNCHDAAGMTLSFVSNGIFCKSTQ